jgi:ATPase subunit of ABC transporter with duplicated ATPase domains
LPQEVSARAGIGVAEKIGALDAATRGRTLSLVAALGSDPARLLVSRAPSPGEVRKLQLALGLGRLAWALVLDEPTNHLDLPSIERLADALARYPGAILLVTHDDAFAARVVDRRWRIADGHVLT